MSRVKNVFTIWKKEMRSYFSSPMAYVALAVFLGITAYFYNTILQLYIRFQFQRFMGFGGGPNLTDHFIRPLYSNMAIILLLISPVLTMRLLTEKKKLGTFELLMTSPITTTQLVLGKYLAALTTFLIFVGFTLVYPLFLFIYSSPEPGPVISTYIALFFLGTAFMAVGTFTSALTENQIIAAVVAFGLLLIFWVIGWASHTALSGAEILKYISLMEHFTDMTRGLITSRNVVFFISFAGYMLFLTITAIESQKWR